MQHCMRCSVLVALNTLIGYGLRAPCDGDEAILSNHTFSLELAQQADCHTPSISELQRDT